MKIEIIYRYKLLGVGLMMCSLNRTVGAVSPLRHIYDLSSGRSLALMTVQSMSFTLWISPLKTTRKQLIIPMTSMPMLHQWVCFARPVFHYCSLYLSQLGKIDGYAFSHSWMLALKLQTYVFHLEYWQMQELSQGPQEWLSKKEKQNKMVEGSLPF